MECRFPGKHQTPKHPLYPPTPSNEDLKMFSAEYCPDSWRRVSCVVPVFVSGDFSDAEADTEIGMSRGQSPDFRTRLRRNRTWSKWTRSNPSNGSRRTENPIWKSSQMIPVTFGMVKLRKILDSPRKRQPTADPAQGSISWDKVERILPLILRGRIRSPQNHREKFQLKVIETLPSGGFIWTFVSWNWALGSISWDKSPPGVNYAKLLPKIFPFFKSPA